MTRYKHIRFPVAPPRAIHGGARRPDVEDEIVDDLTEALNVANELHRELRTGHRPGLPEAVRDCLRELRRHNEREAVLAHRILAETAADVALFGEDSDDEDQ